MKNTKFLAYSVERIAYSQKISAKRYPLNAKILWILVCTFAFCNLYFSCYAQPLSSAELINNAKLYDGKLVVYEGEVIGEVMVRGEYVWLNINDGKSAIGIWMAKDLAGDILAGSYKSRGDWLEVTGIFHRACLQHGGDLDIHCQAMRKVRPGRPVLERLNLSKRNLALVLAGILAMLWILSLLKRK